MRKLLALLLTLWLVPASAQVPMTGAGVGAPSSGGTTFTPTAGPAIQFVNYGSTTVTFASTSIGAASSDRIIIVGVTNATSGRSISSITVGGTGLTRGVSATGGTTATVAELWYGNVTTGTSADIVVTFNTSPEHCGILVGVLSGQSGGGSATPSATNAKASDFAPDPQTFASSMTVNSGGIGIVFSVTQISGAAASWTSTTDSAGDYWVSNASGNTINIALAHTITSGSWNPTVSNMGQYSGNALVALAWD